MMEPELPLPPELVTTALSYLDAGSLRRARALSRSVRAIAERDALWWPHCATTWQLADGAPLRSAAEPSQFASPPAAPVSLPPSPSFPTSPFVRSVAPQPLLQRAPLVADDDGAAYDACGSSLWRVFPVASATPWPSTLSPFAPPPLAADPAGAL